MIGAILLFVAWYVEAEDFTESRVAGQYVFHHDGITQRVTLYPDHRFKQEDSTNGSTKYADGTWRAVSSRGGFEFSSSFIDAPEARRSKETGEVYGIFKNYLGWVSITLDDNTTEIKAYKRLFHRGLPQ
jgi:hypothetical protein